MKYWMVNKFSWGVVLLVFMIFGMGGCKVEDVTWIEKMLLEMEASWIQADKSGLGQEGRDAAVTAVAKKYFRPGMSKEEVFRLLHELKDQGFEIRESRHEGARVWPSKTILAWESAPYPDAATIKHLKRLYAREVSYFSAGKMYGRERLIIEKNVSISFKVADDAYVISDVEAALVADSSI